MNKREKEVLQAQLNNEKAVLKKLEEMYKESLLEINSKIEMLMSRQDADMQHVIYQAEYQKALKTQVQAILENLQAGEFETISEYLAQSYEDGFIGTMYNLQGQGIPLVFPIDQKQVVEAIQTETKLTTRTDTATGKLYASLADSMQDLQKKISGEISRGIAGGQLYTEIARNIAGYARIPKNNAMRIVRTEAGRIQSKACLDACHKAKEKGADIVKQWDSSLDKRTRKSHRELDGQIRELDEKFEVNGHKADAPRMFNVASEDINCRCTMLQRARWAVGNDFTKWGEDAPIEISDDGTTQFHNIEAKNYDDFKNKYKKASERVRGNAQKMKGQNQLEKYGKSSTIGARGNGGKSVYYDEKNDYSIKIDGFSKEVNDELTRAAQSVASLGSEDRNEHMYLVDLSGKKPSYYETNGMPDEVGYKFGKYVDANKDSKFAFVHNHNTDTSFSQTDLETPILYDNIPIQIAVRNDGVKYIAKRSKTAPDDYYPDDYFKDELKDLNEKSRNNEITPAERTRERERIITDALIKEFYEGIDVQDGRK